MNYLLIVFGKSNKQDKFVETLCKDVSVMSDLGDVRYYYGPESVIITFKCSENLESVSNFMNLLYGKMDLVYILLPYEKDKLSVKMDEDTSIHLFDVEKQNNKSDKVTDIESLVRKWISDEIESGELISEIENLENDELDDFLTKKQPPKELSLDELLDKINSNGISTLSEKELSLLNKYSNI